MAGNKELIDEIVDPIAVKQVDDLKKHIAELEASFVSAAKEAIKLNNATGGSTTNSSFTKSAEASSKATKTMVDNAEKTRLAEIRLQQQREKNIDNYNKKLASEASAKQKAVDKEIAADQKQLASEARIARQRDKDSAEYIKLIKQRDKALADARNIGATYGTDGKFFEAATKRAGEYQTKVDAINSKLGEAEKSGGNIATKTFGVARTLANILPNFGIGTFFLVLGTGLVKIFDLLKGGESTVALFNSLAKNTNDIFAEQASKVTLLKKELDGGNVAQNRQREIIEELNQISPTYFGNLKDIGDIVKKLPADYDKYNKALMLNSRIQAGLSLYQDKYKELLESQRKLTEVAEKPRDKSYLGTVLSDFQSIFTLGIKTNEIIKNVGKEGASGIFTGTQKVYQGEIKNTQRALDFLSKGILADQQALQKNGGDIAGQQIKIAQRIANSKVEIEKINLQTTIEANNAIVENDKKSYSDRVKALNNSAEAQKKIVSLSLKQQINDISITNDQKEIDIAESNANIEKINIDTAKKLDDINNSEAEKAKKRRDDALKLAREQAIELRELQNEYEKQIEDARKRGEKAEMERLKKELKDKEDALSDSDNKRLLLNSQYEDEALNLLTSRYKAGLITAKEFEDGRQIIEQEAALESIDSAIQLSEDLIAIQKSYGENTQSEEDKLAKLRLSRSKLVRDGIITDLKTEGEARKKLKDLTKQVAEEAANFVITLVDAGFENRKNKIQEQINLTDENAKAEIDAVNRSLISTSDKADKVKLIEAQADAQKKQLQREQKRTDQEKAKFDKAVSIARIIEATAIAEIEALTYLSNPLTAPFYPGIAGLIAALGAIQLATVLATPIPAYEKGTKNAKGGTSLVGEKGAEYVITPQGATFLTPNKATLMDIPKGSTVIPHLQTARIMDVQKYTGGQAIDMSEVVNAIERNRPVKSKTVISGWLNESKAASANMDRRKQYFN